MGHGDAISGIGSVYLDGRLVSIIDTSQQHPRRGRSSSRCTIWERGAHTLAILVTGEKNDEASGAGMSVDGFEIIE